MVEKNKIETSTAFFYIKEDILFMICKQDVSFTLKDSMENIDTMKIMQAGKQMLMLIDSRFVFQASKRAREYGATKEVSDLSIAKAIVIGDSLAKRIGGNFYIKFNKPATPTKLFKDEKEAVEWLNTFK